MESCLLGSARHMDSGHLRVQRRWLVASLALVQLPGVPVHAGQSAVENSALKNPTRIVFQHNGKNVNGCVLSLDRVEEGSCHEAILEGPDR